MRAWTVGWLVAAAACSGDKEVADPADADADADADTDTDADTDADTDSDADADADADTDCASDATLTIEATAGQGTLPNQILLSVTTSADASVAALCVSDTDPDDAHLVEDGGGTTHELQFLGLLSATAYTCKVTTTCPTASGPAVEVHHTTTAPPIQISVLDVDIDPVLGMTGAYTMAGWQPTLSGRLYVVVWGPDGRARWWWVMPEQVEIDIEALLDPGTSQLVWGGGNHVTGAPAVLDLWDGELYKASLPPWGDDHYTHDTKRVFNGEILSLQYTPVSRGARSWEGFGIRVHDPATSAISFEFDSQRYVDDGTLPVGTGDAYHANWVDYIQTSSGPELWVSLYASMRILAIDGTTGDLLVDFGRGRGWSLFDASGSPIPESELPQGQHGLEIVGGDELWVYDNGVLRQESRAQKWRLDRVNKVATLEWVWTEPNWFEPIVGDIDLLPNDRVLLTEGTVGLSNHPANIVEVDMATGDVASRLTMPTNAVPLYRAERYDGCAMFANASLCPAVAARLAELQPLFDL